MHKRSHKFFKDSTGILILVFCAGIALGIVLTNLFGKHLLTRRFRKHPSAEEIALVMKEKLDLSPDQYDKTLLLFQVHSKNFNEMRSAFRTKIEAETENLNQEMNEFLDEDQQQKLAEYKKQMGRWMKPPRLRKKDEEGDDNRSPEDLPGPPPDDFPGPPPIDLPGPPQAE